MSQTAPQGSLALRLVIHFSSLGTHKKKTSLPILCFSGLKLADDVLILREHISGIDLSRSTNDGLIKWLNATVNVLCTFSAILGGGYWRSRSREPSISLIFTLKAYPPVVVFTRVAVCFFSPLLA